MQPPLGTLRLTPVLQAIPYSWKSFNIYNFSERKRNYPSSIKCPFAKGAGRADSNRQNTCRQLKTLLEFGSNYHVGCTQTITTVLPTETGDTSASSPELWLFGFSHCRFCRFCCCLRRTFLKQSLEAARANTAILAQFYGLLSRIYRVRNLKL